MSKYNKLWEYIKKENKDELIIGFETIKDVLGFDIDHSFLTYKKELLDYGFEVKKISMKDSKVTCVKR